MSWVGFTIGISLITLSALIIIAIYLRNKEEELPDNQVQILNFMRQYTNGYASGSLISIDRGEKRSIVEFMPDDIDYKKSHLVTSKRIVVENDKMIEFPKGTFSDQVSRIWLLPPNSDSLCNTLKNTIVGKKLMAMNENINEETEVKDILLKRLETQKDVLEMTAGGEIMAEYLMQDRQLNKDFKKKYAAGKDDKKTSSVGGFSGPQ